MGFRKTDPEAAARRWNAAYPIGTRVLAYPGVKEPGAGFVTETRSEAWVMGGHTAMVMVERHPGGIALSHVEPRAEQHPDGFNPWGSGPDPEGLR